MTGTRHSNEHRMIVQTRDIALLRELSLMRVVDREQAMMAGGFGSVTRINTRLLALTRAQLLRRFFLGYGGVHKALYALSPKGALLAEVPLRGPRRRQDEMLVADFSIQHQLSINEVYCALKFKPIPVPEVKFHRWLAFHEPLVAGLRLIPDGYLELATPAGIDAAFLEVDLGHEALSVWKEKTRHYLQFALSGEFQKQLGKPSGVDRFRVIVLANSERRLRSIRSAVAATTQKIFWFSTLDVVRNDKFFASVWFRPTEAAQQTYFNGIL
jgi:hypothetical protein